MSRNARRAVQAGAAVTFAAAAVLATASPALAGDYDHHGVVADVLAGDGCHHHETRRDDHGVRVLVCVDDLLGDDD
jgi:hypothetical protein